MWILILLLSSAMVTATYLQGALAVLASPLLVEISLSRSQLGVIFAVFALTGGVLSPFMGNLTDRGPNWVLLLLFTLGAIGFLVSAAAPNYAVLLCGALVSGVALAAGNPVTNRVISQRVPIPKRGLAIGIKQAGSTGGLLVAGLALPAIGAVLGWRWALALSALIPILGLIVSAAFLPPSRELILDNRSPEKKQHVRPLIWLLAGLGLAAAIGISAVLSFLPLFAHEDVGLSVTEAGLITGVMALIGVVARITWGLAADRVGKAPVILGSMALASVPAMFLLGISSETGGWSVWASALLFGGSMLAWHSLAWLVTVNRIGMSQVGKASGTIQLGNSIGFAIGPPLAGLVVDLTSSYDLVWNGVAVLFAGLAILTFRAEWASPQSPSTERRGPRHG